MYIGFGCTGNRMYRDLGLGLRGPGPRFRIQGLGSKSAVVASDSRVEGRWVYTAPCRQFDHSQKFLANGTHVFEKSP